MPHISIEYSANLDGRFDMAALCATLRDAAAATGEFPYAGIRVRATACTHSVIADGNPDHAFMDISVRLRGGRDLETRKAATKAIFDAAREATGDLMAASSFMLSLEMRDIDPELAPKASSIRDHLPEDLR